MGVIFPWIYKRLAKKKSTKDTFLFYTLHILNYTKMAVTKLTIAPGVDQYTLINKSKTLAVMVLTYGAVISHVLTPDKTGAVRDVVLGFDDFESYKNPANPYFGAVVGRYGNR